MASLRQIPANEYRCNNEDIESLLERPLLNNEKEYLKADRERVVFSPKEYNTTHDGIENEPEHAFPVRGNCTMLDERDIGTLKPGDHVAWHRSYIIWHHAVILKADISNKMLLVIHWKNVKDENNKWRITEEWIPSSSQKGQFYRIDYEPEITAQNPPALVLYRARCEIGNSNYQLLNNNCESFATYCKTGKFKSSQEHWFWHSIRATIVETTASLDTHLMNAKAAYAREMSKVTIVDVAKEFSSVTIAETVEKLRKATNIVGAAIVIAIEGCFMIWDISKMYERREDGRISKITFINMATQRFCEALFGVGLLIGGSLAAASLGGALGGLAGSVVPLVGTAIGASIGAFLGSIVGGVLGGISGRALGALVGPYASRAFKDRDDRKTNISSIERGDHIVLDGGFFHRSCHAIVVNKSGNTISVIRNTYARGVVGDDIDVRVSGEIYKKEYRENECYDPAVVVIRARSQLGLNYYSYFSNDCKKFACWCKAKE